MFLTITELKVHAFHLLVQLKVFSTEQMNQAVFAFRRYEDASMRYTGIKSHKGLTHYACTTQWLQRTESLLKRLAASNLQIQAAYKANPR